MKAAVYYETGAPSVFRYEEFPDPECHPRGVVIDVEAISIEGGDVLGRAGGIMARVPHIVGYQCAGTIRQAGEAVTEYQPGQRVVCTMASGSHASVVSVPAAACWPIPEGLDIQQAATVPVAFGTADDCLFEFGHLKSGETVLIQGGAGGVGVAAIQLARRAGATVVATASSDEKLARLVDEFGLHHGINYKSGEFVAQLRSLTAGKGADLVVDPVGGDTLNGSIAALAYRGRCVTVGNASRGSTMVDARPLLQGNMSLTGVYLGAEMATPRARDMIAGHIADMAAGHLRMPIDSTFPLSDAAGAHARIESRQAFGRVLLIP
ncbi:MAG: zinc-binding alcohol dehydrogenase family protein [Dehalococcoidia bacterium]